MELKEKNKQIIGWAKRHPVWSVGIVLFVVGLFSSVFSGGSAPQKPSNVSEKSANVPAQTTEIKNESVQKTTNPTPQPTQVKQTDNQNVPAVSSQTISQKNAVQKAKSYLGYTAFSHDGLVAQLEYEQFSHADAVYGVDNSGANWNEQAAKKAKQYVDYSAFSHGSLVQQLMYDKFTQEQAEYGANAVGL